MIAMPIAGKEVTVIATWAFAGVEVLSQARLSSFLFLFNTVPLHSFKNKSQRLYRCNRGLVLVKNWSKELIIIEDCRD